MSAYREGMTPVLLICCAQGSREYELICVCALNREEENFIFPITIHPDVSG